MGTMCEKNGKQSQVYLMSDYKAKRTIENEGKIIMKQTHIFVKKEITTKGTKPTTLSHGRCLERDTLLQQATPIDMYM